MAIKLVLKYTPHKFLYKKLSAGVGHTPKIDFRYSVIRNSDNEISKIEKNHKKSEKKLEKYFENGKIMRKILEI